MFRERSDGTLERTWPHNGLARLRLDQAQVKTVLRHYYRYWPERKIQRALAHPWRFRRDINWALSQILEQQLEQIAEQER